MQTAKSVIEMIGNTSLVLLKNLSHEIGSEIWIKCEFQNPGGSVKDRAARSMVMKAMERGALKPGMTIVEGTAGNTGIGLAILARHFGLGMIAVMPRGQTAEKEKMISLFGAHLKLVDAVPFADQNHFYHTARRIAQEDPVRYWWADQFENLDNYRAHVETTGPELLKQTQGQMDWIVSAAGTGGTIAGVSTFLKEKIPGLKVFLADPNGSGLHSFRTTGAFKAQGDSMTEGIGIMRLVENFKQAKVDDSATITDQEMVEAAYRVRDGDGLLLGTSSALNVAACIRLAKSSSKKIKMVTFACDLGERSASKLYNPEFLKAKGISISSKH